MTFEDYLRSELAQGKIDFRIRASVGDAGRISFYIHPLDKDGNTRDFIVAGNELEKNPNVFVPDDTITFPDELVDSSADQRMPEGPICGRCYDEGELFPANCREHPEFLINAPIGMYHCPDCGAMVLAGLPHPDLCKTCLDRKHPGFDLD